MISSVIERQISLAPSISLRDLTSSFANNSIDSFVSASFSLPSNKNSFVPKHKPLRLDKKNILYKNRTTSFKQRILQQRQLQEDVEKARDEYNFSSDDESEEPVLQIDFPMNSNEKLLSNIAQRQKTSELQAIERCNLRTPNGRVYLGELKRRAEVFAKQTLRRKMNDMFK